MSDDQMNEISRRVLAAVGLSDAAIVDVGQSLPDADRLLASYIDHTSLKPEATPRQIEQLCAEARRYAFASVCVNPFYVPLCVEALHESDVAVCTVVGFPLGATTTEVKIFETRQAIADGASEIDMVIAIGKLKAGDYPAVYNDIAAVVAVCRDRGAISKVIIEAALLSDEEKIAACVLAAHAGADFVKTSTGFASGGATTADVGLMRRVVGSQIGVKAAGGIRTREEALAMISAGATRIGTSAGVRIVADEGGTR